MLVEAYMQGVFDANNGGGNEKKADFIASSMIGRLCATHVDELAYRKTQAAGTLAMIEALHREAAKHVKEK